MLRPSAFILRRERVAVNRLNNRRANVLAVRTQRSFASGATETAELVRFAVSPTNRAANSPRARGRAGVSPRPPRVCSSNARLSALGCRRRGRVILRYIKALMHAAPLLARMVESETAETLTLTNRLAIEVATARC